jgi:hypothetical protein
MIVVYMYTVIYVTIRSVGSVSERKKLMRIRLRLLLQFLYPLAHPGQNSKMKNIILFSGSDPRSRKMTCGSLRLRTRDPSKGVL